MVFDEFNKHLAVFYIVVGFAGTLPALFPFLSAINTLFSGASGPHDKVFAALILAGLTTGYALMFGYLRYLAGGERHPVRMWVCSTAYNGLLLLAFVNVTMNPVINVWTWALWPLLLTVLSVVATASEYKHQKHANSIPT